MNDHREATPAPAPEDGDPRRRKLHALAHDLRNCLHLVEMGLQILERSREKPTEFDDICEMLRTERAKASDIVTEFLAVASNEESEQTGEVQRAE